MISSIAVRLIFGRRRADETIEELSEHLTPQIRFKKKKFPEIKLFCNSISNRISFLSKIFTETENINRINDAENL